MHWYCPPHPLLNEMSERLGMMTTFYSYLRSRFKLMREMY